MWSSFSKPDVRELEFLLKQLRGGEYATDLDRVTSRLSTETSLIRFILQQVKQETIKARLDELASWLPTTDSWGKNEGAWGASNQFKERIKDLTKELKETA